ncbi:MAG TPA: DUF6527 family protein [Methylophilaceae bacterium]|nr:DUF6527 family protein [Methylophilaceae bacterium]
MKASKIKPVFVEFIPRDIEEGVLYISETYKTASHKCACGCGSRVVTPLSPADWRVIKNNDLVSLHPSIGNWNFPCRSHYWIRDNQIRWDAPLSEKQITRVQYRDRIDKERYIAQVNRKKEEQKKQMPGEPPGPMPVTRSPSLISKLIEWLKN